jgi:hypothetical protein
LVFVVRAGRLVAAMCRAVVLFYWLLGPYPAVGSETTGNDCAQLQIVSTLGQRSKFCSNFLAVYPVSPGTLLLMSL